MLRAAEILNLSGEPIRLVGGWTVQPYGRLVLSHEQYIQAAIDNDFSALDVDVSLPDLQLRSVSVRDFGATGDGATDDTYAMQSAIDSVASLGGGSVNVPIGVYLVSTVVLHGEVSLVGDSTAGTVLKQVGGVSRPVLSVSRGTVSVRYMTFVGNGEGE